MIKVISTIDRKPFMGPEIIGEFKSPYENRLCIIIAEISHGWEGPPHNIFYNVVGCHLETGYY